MNIFVLESDTSLSFINMEISIFFFRISRQKHLYGVSYCDTSILSSWIRYDVSFPQFCVVIPIISFPVWSNDRKNIIPIIEISHFIGYWSSTDFRISNDVPAYLFMITLLIYFWQRYQMDNFIVSHPSSDARSNHKNPLHSYYVEVVLIQAIWLHPTGIVTIIESDAMSIVSACSKWEYTI